MEKGGAPCTPPPFAPPLTWMDEECMNSLSHVSSTLAYEANQSMLFKPNYSTENLCSAHEVKLAASVRVVR